MSKSEYTVLQTYGNYTVLKRNTDFQPFIVANNLHDDMSWDYGHYFQDLFSAVDFARDRGQNRIPYERMSEIASKAIDGLFEDDSETAYEYCENEIELTEEEIEYFGIKENYE